MDSSVNARIGYLAPMKDYPISHAGYPDYENLEFNWQMMPAVDAATIPGGASLQSHGFAAISHQTEVRVFDASEQWHEQFKAEVERIIKAATGAAEVIVGGVSYRNVDFRGSHGPALFCHNDYTPGSAARHIAQIDPAQADRRLSKRFATYNLWRLVSQPPQNLPLALCDARSVASSDFVPGEARFEGPEKPLIWGEIAMFRHNPAHRWHYFPKLRNDQILVFCGYDSDPSYASIVPHTAFADPNCPANVPPRANAEARCYAFFD